MSGVIEVKINDQSVYFSSVYPLDLTKSKSLVLSDNHMGKGSRSRKLAQVREGQTLVEEVV
jgi:hypothetical protein